MERYVGYIIQSTEKRVRHFLKDQIKDTQSPGCGMLKGELLEVKATVYSMTEAISVYLNPASGMYRDTRIKLALERGIHFVSRMQGKDGLFDFPSCNFHSAPDTAFCLKRMTAACRLMELWDREGLLASLREVYLSIIRKAVFGLIGGGFHTPNHRWAIAAALLQGHELFRSDTNTGLLKSTADLYLGEGLDCNEDGEYPERSAGNYNAVVNASMITMYEITGDRKFLDCILKNLDMMLTLIDPDDKVFTYHSVRQDKGKGAYPIKYFYQYLYAAAKSGGQQYEKAAHKIIKDCMERGQEAPECLYILMQYEYLYCYRLTGYGFLEHYRRYLSSSGMLRVKNRRYTYSVMKDNSPFLYWKAGTTQLSVRIGESCCEVRSFLPETVRLNEQGCTLEKTIRGWYYLPWEKPQDTSDWWEMDHTKRDKIYTEELKTMVRIDESEDGIKLNMKAEGLAGLPLRVEVKLPEKSRLEYDKANILRKGRRKLIVKSGEIMVIHENRKLKISGGAAEHTFTGHYSESDGTDEIILYFNLYTPCEHSIRIELVPEE